MNFERLKPFSILFLLPVAAALICLCIGRFWIPVPDVFSSIISYFTSSETTQYESLVMNIRLPRILLALLVGGGLALAGATFQSALSNPLASPDVIGVSSGAAFGAILGILIGGASLLIQSSAVLFGLISMIMVFALCKYSRSDSILMIVLAGIIISGVFTALISLIKYIADPLTQLPDIVYWLMGSLTGATYDKLLIAAPLILIGMCVIILLKWRLNIISLSDEEIRALGHNPRKLRWIMIVAATLIVATCVSMCGQIGWIGLVIPHVARLIVGSDNRRVIPYSIVLGAVFLLIMDTLCRSLFPAEIPLSIMTALVGAPLFAALFMKHGRRWN